MTHFIVLHNLVIVAKAFKRVRQVDTFQRQLSNTSFAQYIQRMCTRQFKPKLVSRFLFLVYILFCLLQMQTMKKKENFIIGLAIIIFQLKRPPTICHICLMQSCVGQVASIVIDMMWHIQNAHEHIWSQNTCTRRNMGFVITLFTTICN